MLCRLAVADAYDPPAGYYSAATGSGATLKQQLHDVIDSHTVLPYNSDSSTDTRSALQVTDADPNNPGHILLVYDRVSLDVSGLAGPPTGWDFGATWDREHTWPRSRGIFESGADNTDLHAMRPSTPTVNGSRGNRNFGGAYGAQSFGIVSDSAPGMWYPGNADAGMIARSEFYMAVRYDGGDSATTNLELSAGNPADSGTMLGDLNRMIEWHFAAPPDDFERRRNQIIYDDYQHNRNPFIDRPEFVWSVFVDQSNDSRITIGGTTPNANGGSTRNVDLGRVFVGGAVPAAQSFTLNKTGNDGTYYEVTTSGAATSSIAGRFNAFRTNQTDSAAISVGLDTTTTSAGLRTGTVTIDNLDITTGGGTGRGANDANDTFNVSLAVLDHPLASFSFNIEQRERVIDFGILPIGSDTQSWASSLTNLAAFGAPEFAANLDLDGVTGVGETGAFQVDLAPFSGLEQGDFVAFDSLFFPDTVGQFAATYTLNLSDEDLPGEQTQQLTLSLMAQAILAGDFNRDNVVDAADYGVWRKSYGQSVPQYTGGDGDGDGTIGDGDYNVWQTNFGTTAAGSGEGRFSAAVPEPASVLLLAIGFVTACHCLRRADLRLNPRKALLAPMR